MTSPMPGWLIFAALGAIAITALLTWLLWRINLAAGANASAEAGGDNERGPGGD